MCPGGAAKGAPADTRENACMRFALLAWVCLGCGGSAETCVSYRLSYAGSAQGVVLVTETDRDPSGAWAGSGGQVFPSVADALALNRVSMTGATTRGTGGGVCWGYSIEKHLTAEV